MKAAPGPAIAACMLALLVGCAGLPGSAPPPVPRPAAAQISAYTLSGRISVRQAEARYIANISWRHAAAADEIMLTTPFGSGIAALTRDASGASLVSADHGRLQAPDWDALAAQAFGAELPLARLPRWLLADVPAGAQRDAAGRPRHFAQDGWEVDFERYESEAPAALPVLIEFRRGDIEVRLKIDTWELVR